ncbi:hypothetical protein ACU4GD_19605 [Cupriavidus basilensis]
MSLAGGMQLDAGNRLPVAASVAAMTWPAGVPLPFPNGTIKDSADPAFNGVVLASALTLRKGAVVPSETVVKLPGDATMVTLRPRRRERQPGPQLGACADAGRGLAVVVDTAGERRGYGGGGHARRADPQQARGHAAGRHALRADAGQGTGAWNGPAIRVGVGSRCRGIRVGRAGRACRGLWRRRRDRRPEQHWLGRTGRQGQGRHPRRVQG